MTNATNGTTQRLTPPSCSFVTFAVHPQSYWDRCLVTQTDQPAVWSHSIDRRFVDPNPSTPWVERGGIRGFQALNKPHLQVAKTRCIHLVSPLF